MKLYSFPLSGHAHRARLMLSLIGIAYELQDVDLSVGEQKSNWFLELNSFGEVPVLDDGGRIISDSNAILVYLARKFGPSHWLPSELIAEAAIQRWLSVAAGKVAYGLCAARLIKVFGASFSSEEVVERAHQTLRVLDFTLQHDRWIAGTVLPTIADVALYSYIESAHEGDVDIGGYFAVREWMSRFEILPGFVSFSRT